MRTKVRDGMRMRDASGWEEKNSRLCSDAVMTVTVLGPGFGSVHQHVNFLTVCDSCLPVWTSKTAVLLTAGNALCDVGRW